VEQHDTVLYEQVLKDHVVSEATEEKSWMIMMSSIHDVQYWLQTSSSTCCII
jgi:hypothetical protein